MSPSPQRRADDDEIERAEREDLPDDNEKESSREGPGGSGWDIDPEQEGGGGSSMLNTTFTRATEAEILAAESLLITGKRRPAPEDEIVQAMAPERDDRSEESQDSEEVRAGEHSDPSGRNFNITGWGDTPAITQAGHDRVSERDIVAAESPEVAQAEQRPATEEEIRHAEREDKPETTERQRPATEEEIKEAEKDK